jgi:coenzyme F420-0:L-glutamate ligase/coenzyme F420-1:gamma-L-glutamate ligase
MSLVLTALAGIPLIHAGDDLAPILLASLQRAGTSLLDGDVLVLAQKIVSKAEGRMVRLDSVLPSAQAQALAEASDKDARFCELVLRESREVLRVRPGTIIVEHRLGFVCANAGIDHSNVDGPGTDPEQYVLLLPEDPDATAARLRGVTGTSIGLSGLPGLVDMRGQPDLFGFRLRVTTIAAADELAAAASLVMGQAAEGTPAIHVRGFPYPLREGSLHELIRPHEEDLFR